MSSFLMLPPRLHRGSPRDPSKIVDLCGNTASWKMPFNPGCCHPPGCKRYLVNSTRIMLGVHSLSLEHETSTGALANFSRELVSFK